ncbi:flagellar basal body rod protein [Robertmurraya yapensis]|uniref:Flagellar basal body rod protein n=2 Tax=Bacillaceae TaxID=186817 RepID=A0A431W1J7_9BACI|nr:flagellar basal body rod protein [Bacillus yapensis]RTR29223.1 flagellar basal body rod protein [Bacillus yapensis]TKS94828.1 flagellar basal body rod protein [Bacillus yapensis]
MKKFGLLLLGVIAASILIANVGPIVGLIVSLTILYFVFKQFLKTESVGGKIALGILGVFLLLTAASNAPAIIGVAAAYVLYIVYKKWNGTKKVIRDDNDPFQNFEKQWSELNK